MRTNLKVKGEAGFTLIEVLAAMMILAIGLMGLQALGIGAARSVVRADRQSELAAIATATIETNQQAIRNNPGGMTTGASCDTDAASGIALCIDLQNRTSAPGLPVGAARVTVRASHPQMAQDTFRITSYVYDPALP